VAVLVLAVKVTLVVLQRTTEVTVKVVVAAAVLLAVAALLLVMEPQVVAAAQERHLLLQAHLQLMLAVAEVKAGMVAVAVAVLAAVEMAGIKLVQENKMVQPILAEAEVVVEQAVVQG
jgi:hypothetical protein